MRKASPSGTMKVESEERRERMRVMLSFTIQPEKGDALIKEGRIGETLESILEDLQPEVAYFTDVEGTRGGYLVVNIDDASQIPAMTEPLLLGVGATVQMHPNDSRRPARGRGVTAANGTKV